MFVHCQSPKTTDRPSRGPIQYHRDVQRRVSADKGLLLILLAGPRAEATMKDLALEVTMLLQRLSLKVFWFFSGKALLQKETLTVSDIYMSLIYQILASTIETSNNDAHLIYATKFQNLFE